jgi:HTH-type transcriptional regulator/antitoxin HigA
VKFAPIRSDETYKNYLARAAALMSKYDRKAVDELEVLQALIERWERSQYNLPAPSPIEAIRFRMSQQGLRPRDLEPYIGSRSRVSEVLSGSRPLSIDMIRALAKHLGIPAASLIGVPVSNQASRRAKPSKAAMEKLRTLGVMKPQEDFGDFIDRGFQRADQLALLRKTRTDRTNAKTDLAALEGWCAAVMLEARAVKMTRVQKYVPAEAGRELARLSTREDGPACVREALAELGVIFITLDHLPGTYLDGAALRRTDGRPVIAMTLRYDRLDNFWFTLLHEFCHVARHLDANRQFIVDDLEVKTSDDIEAEADKFAQDTLIPPEVWESHSSPDLDTGEIQEIASKAEVHPAIVAGRWQRDHSDYRRFSKLLGRGEVRACFPDESGKLPSN